MALPAKALVPAFRWSNGAHCGSSAFRDLVAHHCGLRLSEAMIFGLSEALYSLAVMRDDWFVFSGWNFLYHQHLKENLGLDMCVVENMSDDETLHAIRSHVANGRVVLATGDGQRIFGINYHTPLHQFLIAGYDETHVLVMERRQQEPKRLSLEDLRWTLNTKDDRSSFIVNRFLYLRSDQHVTDLRPPGLRALYNMARRMIFSEPQTESMAAAVNAGIVYVGMNALCHFKDSLPLWRDQLPQSEIRARFQALFRWIMVSGADRGFFRNSFTGFLQEMVALAGPWPVQPRWVTFARQSAEIWLSLAVPFNRLGEIATSSGLANSDTSSSVSTVCVPGDAGCYVPPSAEEAALWHEIVETLGQIIVLETSLFHNITTTLAPVVTSTSSINARL